MLDGRQYQEGERLPPNEERPCEVCYCIKGARKCAVKKCAPVIHGCVPKLPEHGACCPTSYDCRRRSLKVKRQSRQEEEELEEDDSDTIDFFSLLFGSDEPKEQEAANEVPTTTIVSSSTPPPFVSLPSSTESSFFDLIRAGLEIIDANSEKIDSQLNKIVPTTADEVATTATELILSSTTERMRETFEISTTSKEIKTTTYSSINELKKTPSSTEMPKSSVSSTPKTSTTQSFIESSTQRATTNFPSTVKSTPSSTTIGEFETKVRTLPVFSVVDSGENWKRLDLVKTCLSMKNVTLNQGKDTSYFQL